MCGIVGYLGKKEVFPILIEGLQKLEYRGYDSAGVAILNEDLNVYKVKGKVSDLLSYTKDKDQKGNIGIGHTRWATHGKPSKENAHPHTSQFRSLALIHNGIIENHESIKKELLVRGHEFQSETDTEVLVHLIEDILENDGCTLVRAVQLALKRIIGAYAIIVLSKNDPNKLIAARKSSPLVVGIEEGEFYLASDATAIGNNVQSIVYLKDEEVAICSYGKDLEIKTLGDKKVTPYIEDLDRNVNYYDKAGYEHYMLKEIHEQPRVLKDSMGGRIDAHGNVALRPLLEFKEKFEKARRIIMVSCGTSWHACLTGEYMIEQNAKVPVEVEYASEFRYRNPIIYPDDIVIIISQSGETADSLAALKIAKEKGAFTFGICNVIGSSIARETDTGLYTHAGTEIGVASTKAFTTQLMVLAMMSIQLGIIRETLGKKESATLVKELMKVPSLMQETLKCERQTEMIAASYSNFQNFIFLGRGINFPIALEGALKLKEISYIHAEGYPAAEMKHGPIALIDKQMPVLVIANNSVNYEKVLSNIQEVKAREGQVIAIVNKDDHEMFKLADSILEVKSTSDFLSPFLAIIPLQFIAYHIAKRLGKNVDQPRNLAKSVTVE